MEEAFAASGTVLVWRPEVGQASGVARVLVPNVMSTLVSRVPALNTWMPVNMSLSLKLPVVAWLAATRGTGRVVPAFSRGIPAQVLTPLIRSLRSITVATRLFVSVVSLLTTSIRPAYRP